MSGVFCPVCKRKNHISDVYCQFCGTSLKFAQPGPATTTRRIDPDSMPLSDEEERKYITSLVVPAVGIALYMMKDSQPIAVREEAEFILGRKLNPLKPEAVVDLSPYGGFELGVSHRHAMILWTGTAYEITDLDSTNGTFLNRKRILPATAYLLPGGSTIRLGKMILYAVYKGNTPK
ncbi:MAG TPA: FHA domain-containing protein [Anaerolineales bacterium]|nr:FHA domain-containing protein [Anaerolineales bacterium]